jgi:hypothetical protein
VDGLLLKLLADPTGRPGYWFARLFAGVLQDLDLLWWFPVAQPWMAAPDGFAEDGPLWRRGGLRRYGRHFAEEDIELWGFASSALPAPSEAGAAGILRYTDSTCWELYTVMPGVLDRVAADARGMADVLVVRGRSDRRAEAFGQAGLREVWRRMNGRW